MLSTYEVCQQKTNVVIQEISVLGDNIIQDIKRKKISCRVEWEKLGSGFFFNKNNFISGLIKIYNTSSFGKVVNYNFRKIVQENFQKRQLLRLMKTDRYQR